jgi:hypothetical protein
MDLNPLNWIFQPINDFNQMISLVVLGFKIVFLLFIVQFVRARFGGGAMVSILILVLGYVFLEYLAPIFLPMMFLYLFIAFGFSYMLMDLVIAKPWAGGGEEAEAHMTGKQYAEETAKRQGMQRRLVG